MCAIYLALTQTIKFTNLLTANASSGLRDSNAIIIWSTEDPGANILRAFPIPGGGYIAQQYNSDWGNSRFVKYNSNNNYVWDIPVGTISKICPLYDGSFWVAGSDGSWGAQIGYVEKYTSLGVKITGSKISFADFAEVTSGGSFNITCADIAVVDDGLVVCGLFNGNYDLAMGDNTRVIERNGANLNSVIFKIGFDGRLLMVKELSCAPNAIRVSGCKKLYNGNIAFHGYTNNSSSNVPGLACISGYDEFVLVIDGQDLAQNVCTIDWVKTINVSGNHYSLDNMRVNGNTVFLYGSSDASNGFANASTRAVLGPDATWGVNSSILIAFDGNNKGNLLFIDNKAIETFTVACAGFTVDNDGSYIALYTISKSGWTYSKIVKFDDTLQIISEIEIGEAGDITTVNDIAKTGRNIIIVGNANYRFNTGVPAVGIFDAFIYVFGSFQAEIITAPTIADSLYTYGDLMPTLQGGSASIAGTFAWEGTPTLITGTNNYAWIFIPTAALLEPIHGYVSITVQRSIKETPTNQLTVKITTPTSIEFDPIDDAQYSINGGLTWQDSPLFENLKPSTKYTAAYRLKGDDNHEPSLVAANSFVKTLADENNDKKMRWELAGVIAIGVAIIAVVLVVFVRKKTKVTSASKS